MTSLTAEWKARFQSKAKSVTFGWPEDEEDALPTGSLALDAALGIGGFPRGKLVEVYGVEGAGKSTLALATIAQCGKRGGRAALLESEHKLTGDWVRKNGVDTSRTLFMNCADALDGVRMLYEVIHSGEFDLVVIDSVAGLIWNTLDPSMGDATGQAEHVLEQSLPLIVSEAYRTNTCLLALNQVRRDPEKLFGDTTMTVGGQVLRHHCSVRVELSKQFGIKRTEKLVIGHLIKATVKKNSLADCFTTAVLPFTYARGLDDVYELVQVGKDHAMFDRERGHFHFEGQFIGTTALETYDYLLSHPATRDAIRNKLAKRVACSEKGLLSYAS